MGIFGRTGLGLLAATSVLSTSITYGQPTPVNTASPVLVNFDHLDQLHDTVPYPAIPLTGHSTVDAGQPLDIWWVYANRDASGGYKPVGGGTYDSSTNTWGQGVSDLDDVARIAVTYLQHYQLHHDAKSLDMAYKALRFVMYMQIDSGPHKGNFVNWIEPNGQPNLNPQPTEDTGSTFDWWGARSLWAMAMGYHVFKDQDPAFAAVLQSRTQMAVASLSTQVDSKYGTFYDIHGYKLPKWLISDGADASSVAVLGLSQWYGDTKNPAAKDLLQKLAYGVECSQIHSAPNQWPYNAHEPWQQSIDTWEAWGSREVMALAYAGQQLHEQDLIQSAKAEADSLYPHMLLSFGPINGWQPAPDDLTQIAYGAESMIDSLLALSQVTKEQIYAKEAGILAGWYLGNNSAHTPMYQPDTGVTYDGINSDGTVNTNSGAESTVTALLALIDVEANPVSNHTFLFHTPVEQSKTTVINGDSGITTGNALIQTAPEAWTGDFLWRTGKYVQLSSGGSVTYQTNITSPGKYFIQLCYDKQQIPLTAVGIQIYVDDKPLGTVWNGGALGQGDAPDADYLWLDMLDKPIQLSAGSHSIRLEYKGQSNGIAKIDSLIVQPMIEQERVKNSNGGQISVTHNLESNQLDIG